jgi:NADPH-dependent 2,4-dienoyl-CoA reductase/sulfur reductase-like enzyme
VRRRAFLRLGAAICGAALLRPAAASGRGGARARVLIAGAGFAGAACAMQLRRINSSIDVMLVDPDDPYATCPMSNAVLAGFRSTASITVSRRGLERAGVRFVRDRVAAVDVRGRRARLGGGGEVAFDRLVVAPGIRFLWGEPQGYDERAAQRMPHAWVAGRQTELLAAQLRGMRSGGVVAISVPSGLMRCPPGPFERASLIAAYLKRHNPRAKVLIFDANNRMPRQDAFAAAWESEYGAMIEWIPMAQDGTVLRVSPSRMILHTSQQAHRVDVANVIPRQAPGLLAAQTGLASGHGWCPIDAASFESTLVAGVHVIGDACIADPMPKSASAAGAQAKQCALAIAAAFEGREAPAPDFASVCYSLLARDRALAIHGRFAVTGGVIEAVAPDIGAAPTAEMEARNAEQWYRSIVTDAFGGA